ncbi:MAG: polysaccharide deacetylase family protein [Deltaproteobacteria bacterium]|nr:polysaccharide deacetylase family protein [Deltaproteobacteria bacterium]
MRTTLIAIFALGLIIGVLFVTMNQFEEKTPDFGPGGDLVLVIHDVVSPGESAADQLVSAHSIVQLLGHFRVGARLVSTGDYEKGMLSEAAYGIYVGTKTDQPLPTYLLDDIFHSTRPFLWIGANLERLQARHNLDNLGLKSAGGDDAFATNVVIYRNQPLAKIDLRTFKVEITRAQAAQVLAEAKYVSDPPKPAQAGLDIEPGTPARLPSMLADEILPAGLPPLPAVDVPPLPTPRSTGEAASDVESKTIPGTSPQAMSVVTGESASVPPPSPPPAVSLPWIVRSQNFWYVASDPIAYHIEGGAYLAFADVLFDFFGEKGGDEHFAFVRIEDVHPKREQDTLRKAADLLAERKVPFAFTLVPVYRNGETGEPIYLSEAPEFLKTVRYLISKGGVPILHGFTHQHTAETAVDFEFWEGETGGHPIAQDKTYASQRIEQALNECFVNEIYPLAWTTPHYAAGQADYDAFADYFTTVVERRMPVESYGSDQFFPYLILSDMHRQIIIPESLGYVNPAVGRDAAALLRDADAMKVVRDGWASFFFHTFLDLDLLAQIVDGLKERDFRFVSLTEFNNKVTTRDRVVVSGVGEVQLTLDSQYRNERTYNARGELLDENFSFGTVKGNVTSLVTLRPEEFQVIQGVYRRPPVTATTLNLFRPTISGISNPVAIVLLFIGMITLVLFLGIWIFLVTRRTVAGAKRMAAVRRHTEEF